MHNCILCLDIGFHENGLNYSFKGIDEIVKATSSVTEGCCIIQRPLSAIRLRRFHINQQSRATEHAHVKLYILMQKLNIQLY